MAELTCPKCQSDMRSYERNGVTVDQCTGCRGVFLDRGELERLVDAESAYYEAPREHRRHDHDDDDDDDFRHRGGFGGHFGEGGFGHGRRKKREREGFLGELFDFG